MQNITEIFQNALYTNDNTRNVVKLNKVLSGPVKNNSDEILNFILKGCIDKVLILQKSKGSTDNIIDFIGEWLSGVEDEAFNASMHHLLKRTQAADKNVRGRACRIIARTLQSFKDEKEVDDNMLDMIPSILQQRLDDKTAFVRCWAIRSLKKFQNPHDNENKIISMISRLMSSDTSSEVRVAAVETLILCDRTLPDIINRIKDVNSFVRQATIRRLEDDNIDPRHLTRQLKATLIQYGLQDRDEEVQVAVKSLFLHWVELLHFNIPKLLLQLGVDSIEADMLAKCLLEESEKRSNLPSELRRVVKEQRIDWESDFRSTAVGELFWTLMRCEYYQQKAVTYNGAISIGASEIVEGLLPDTLQLCRLLREALPIVHGDEPESQTHVQAQLKTLILLRLTTFADQSDEAGRVALAEVCREMLAVVALPERLVTSVLSVWMRTSSVTQNGNTVVDCVLGLINTHWKNAAELENQKPPAGEDEDDEEEDDEVLNLRMRAAELAVWALQQALGVSGPMRTAVLGLRKIIDEALQQPVPELRAAAMHGMGLIGLLHCDCDQAKGNAEEVSKDSYDSARRIALQTVNLDDEEVCTRSQALQTLADMALVRPVSAQQDPALVNLLLRLLDGQEPSLLYVAAEATAKLLFNGVLTDARLFAKLLILFFRPDLLNFDDVDEDAEDGLGECQPGRGSGSGRLQQLLNVFFKAFFRAGAGRELVVLSATVELVAEFAGMIREGEADVTVLNQILDHLLMLSENFVRFTPSRGPGQDVDADADAPLSPEEDPCSQARRAIKLRAVLALLRELLKLGNGVIDRTLSKELFRTLGSIANMTVDWVSPLVAPSLADALACVAKRYSLDKDKVASKIFDRLQGACEAAMDANCPRTTPRVLSADTLHATDGKGSRTSAGSSSSSSSASESASETARDSTDAVRHVLFDLAPGLADLVLLADTDGTRRHSGSKAVASGLVAQKKLKKSASSKKSEATEVTSPTTASPVTKRSRAPVQGAVGGSKKRGQRTPAKHVQALLEDACSSPDCTGRSPCHKRDRTATSEASAGFCSPPLNASTVTRASSRIASTAQKVNYYESSDIEDIDDYSD